MNKFTKTKKLNRKTSHRMSMLLNMSVSLFMHKRIQTTLPKAKTLRPFAEKLVTKAIEILSEMSVDIQVAKKRHLLSILKNNANALNAVLDFAKLHKSRQGGYLRIVKSYYRNGDSAESAFIESVE